MATVAELRADLDARGIEYPADARKPDLEALAAGRRPPAGPASPAAAGYIADQIAKIDEKVARLQDRRAVLARRQASLPAGVDPAGGRGRRRQAKG